MSNMDDSTRQHITWAVFFGFALFCATFIASSVIYMTFKYPDKDRLNEDRVRLEQIKNILDETN